MQILMNDAAQNDVITKNKLAGISIDGAKAPSSKSLSEKGFNTTTETAKKILSDYDYDFAALLTLGERREELLGLKYNSFKFTTWNDEEICTIPFDQGRTNSEPTGGPLKNDASYRTIYVRGEMLELCKFMIQYSKNICTRTGRIVKEDGYLLVSEKTGMPVGIQRPNKILKRVQDKTGVHVSPHIFRHYFATMAMTNGQVATDVVHWLGHSSLNMTESYTRENARGAINVLNGMEPTLLKGTVAKKKEV